MLLSFNYNYVYGTYQTLVWCVTLYYIEMFKTL